MKRIALFLVILLLIGCVPTQPVMISAETLVPSDTSLPPSTPQLTRTKSPSRTPALSLTPSLSLTASLTTTPVPPLITHKWHPETVLLKLESGGGDGCCLYTYPPSLVLYANGRIIVSRGFEENDEWRNQLITQTYAREETCSILNTIDQTGFLDYNARDYRPQNGDYFSIDGAGDMSITVNAWKSNSGTFFGLGSYLQLYGNSPSMLDDPGSPVIPASLRDVYYFLEELSPANAEVYQPQRLGLIVSKYSTDISAVPIPNSPLIKWPFDEISLWDIEKLTTKDNEPSQLYVVEGNIATSIYSYFGNSFAVGG